jgi:Dolichyl-phosphate-mannose-protein mannosyltransferase
VDASDPEDETLEPAEMLVQTTPQPGLQIDGRHMTEEEELLGSKLGHDVGDGMQDVRHAAQLRVRDNEEGERHEIGDEAPRSTDNYCGDEQDQQEAIGGEREPDEGEPDDQSDPEGGRGGEQSRAREVGHRWAPALVLAAVALTIAMRAAFVDAPLTADEGGYGEVARLWEAGGRLYGDVWVDRPQGLLLVFRGVLEVGDSPALFRWAAILVAVAIVLVLFRLGVIVGGRIVGIAAALLMATAGASPWIESFTLAGELVALLPATAAVWAFARYQQSGGRGVLVGAGILAGCALMVKQSAVDATIAIVATLVITRGRQGIRSAVVVLACACLPIAAGLALSGDPSAWWQAVVSYRAQGDSLLTGSLAARGDQFLDTLPAALAGVGLLVALAAVGWRDAPVLARAWLAGAAVGVLGGGNFHSHYYIQLAAPLALIAGFGIARVHAVRAGATAAIAAGVAVAVAALTLPLALDSPNAQARAIWPHDPHLTSDSAVAAWVRANSATQAPVQVLWGAASVSFLANRRPALPIMWKRPLESVPGALTELRLLLDRRVPVLVVLAQPVSAGDPSGTTERILRENYRVVATVAGIPILRVRD